MATWLLTTACNENALLPLSLFMCFCLFCLSTQPICAPWAPSILVEGSSIYHYINSGQHVNVLRSLTLKFTSNHWQWSFLVCLGLPMWIAFMFGCLRRTMSMWIQWLNSGRLLHGEVVPVPIVGWLCGCCGYHPQWKNCICKRKAGQMFASTVDHESCLILLDGCMC